MRTATGLATVIFVDVLLTGCGSASTPPETGIPDTSASAVTFPPADMTGIDTESWVFGTGADPDMITLGPKTGTHPDWPPYAGKYGVEFELPHGTPVLAPLDMTLTGFSNRNAEYRVQSGVTYTPFNDLMLCFESASPDWPGMIIVVYHLSTSPLLRGHYRDPDCSECEEWGSREQLQGHLYFNTNDVNHSGKGNPGACDAMIGYTVKRGELIGFAGSVGDHSMASFCFKVMHTEENPIVEKGNRYLHWVQPDAFFYWKCYGTYAEFPPGVLAYPFECGGFSLPEEQRDTAFKYPG